MMDNVFIINQFLPACPYRVIDIFLVAGITAAALGEWKFSVFSSYISCQHG
jgi:hypothetical protein